jgi:hypothetical protein
MNRRIATAMTIAAAALIAPAAAKATPLNDSYAVSVASASHDIGSYHIGGTKDFGFGGTTWDLNITSRVNWTGSLPVVASWNSTNVRQGAALPVSRVSPMVQTGALHVTWHVTGWIIGTSLWNDGVDKTLAVDASCAPALMGPNYECTANAPGLYLMRQSGMPAGPYMKLKLKAKFTITPEGAVVSRSLSTAGFDPVAKSGLAVSPAPVTDTVNVPCAVSGSPVGYKLGPIHWTPAVSVIQQPTLEIGSLDAVLGQVEMPAFSEKPIGNPALASPKFDLTGSAHTTQLGTLLPNNVAPAIAPMDFIADAGQTMQLHADVSSRCDIASMVWKFSDGTTAYGDWPAKTFTKSLSGQLKVTDSSGLSATRDFNVYV